MKKFWGTLLAMMMAVAAFGVPARRGSIIRYLADGTAVEVQAVGDEFGHWFVDSQNNHYRETDGTLRKLSEQEFARLQKRAEERRMERNEQRAGVRKAPRKEPSLNIAPRGLLILAEFQDVQFQPSNTQAEMDSMLNGNNYSYDISLGSARKYFQDQSNGTYNPHFDVVGPVTLPQPMAYYGQNLETDDDRDGDDAMIGDFVLHACSIASQLPGVDLSQYDNDYDGYVDFVYIIYAGYGEADGGGENTLWPASFDLPSAIYWGYSSLPSDAYWEPSNYTFDGVAVGSFAYSGELNYIDSYWQTRGYSLSNPMRNGIGTFCHEFSHVIGLPDYYDTEYGYNYQHHLTPGGWSLMDGGSYNGDGEVPPCYSIYDKAFVGWANPTLLSEPQVVTLPADGQTGYYITQDGSEATPYTEGSTVYYLENRQKTGWDSQLPGHGMLIWKVKYNEYTWISNEVNNTDRNPLLNYVPASGVSSQDQSDPFPGTGRVTSYSPFEAYPLTNIAEANRLITFDFMGGIGCEGYEIQFTGQKTTLTGDELCVTSGSSWRGTVTANPNCQLTEVNVLIRNTTVGRVVYSRDNTSATITIDNVTDDVQIIATARRPQRPGTCPSYEWTANRRLAPGTVTLGDYNWILSSSATNYGYENGRGAQFGNMDYAAKRVTLTTEESDGCMADEIVVNASQSAGSDSKLTVYIGGQQIENSKRLNGSATDYYFYNDRNATGDLTIEITNTTKAAFLKSIQISYKEMPTAVESPKTERSVKKVIIDGRLYITVNGITYDIMGNRIH